MNLTCNAEYAVMNIADFGVLEYGLSDSSSLVRSATGILCGKVVSSGTENEGRESSISDTAALGYIANTEVNWSADQRISKRI